MQVGRDRSTGTCRSPPALVSPLGTPLPRRPPLKGIPKGGNPSPHAALRADEARRLQHGAPGGLRAGQGPRPGPPGARPVQRGRLRRKGDSGPASGSPAAPAGGSLLDSARCTRFVPAAACAPLSRGTLRSRRKDALTRCARVELQRGERRCAHARRSHSRANRALASSSTGGEAPSLNAHVNENATRWAARHEARNRALPECDSGGERRATGQPGPSVSPTRLRTGADPPTSARRTPPRRARARTRPGPQAMRARVAEPAGHLERHAGELDAEQLEPLPLSQQRGRRRHPPVGTVRARAREAPRGTLRVDARAHHHLGVVAREAENSRRGINQPPRVFSSGNSSPSPRTASGNYDSRAAMRGGLKKVPLS